MAITLKQESHLDSNFKVGRLADPTDSTSAFVNDLQAELLDGTRSASIIHVGDTLTVKIPSFVQQNFFLWPYDAAMAGAKYKAKVYIERMGDDPDAGGTPTPTGSFDVTYAQGSRVPSDMSQPITHYQQNYGAKSVDITGLTEGAYKVVLTFNLYNPAGDISPWHSFNELGFIEVVKPKPVI